MRRPRVKVTLSVPQTSLFESGDHAGLKHDFVMRRAASPVAPMMKIPPPSHSERYAIIVPSGENAGWPSAMAQRFVRLIALRPFTRWR